MRGGLEWPETLRLVGRDATVATVVQRWQESQKSSVPAALPLSDEPSGAQDSATAAAVADSLVLAPPAVTVSSTEEDYAQIDLALAIQESPILSEEPAPGTGYGAFTPAQRFHFLHWLDNITLAAPTAFRQLYLANLECNLFDNLARQRAAWQEILRLSAVPTWQTEELLWRLVLLGFHLTGDGPALNAWLCQAPPLPPSYLGLALGQLALVGEPLSIDLLSLLLQKWQVTTPQVERALLQLRLAYLNSTLGAEPLRYLLRQLDEHSLSPKPWRTAHRNLRLRIVQPDLRQPLLPLLRELATLTQSAQDSGAGAVDEAEAATALPATADNDEIATKASGKRSRNQANESKQPWQLVLEFGDSRSEYFTYALNQAKRMPGYLQIMDENRRMIHRVHFEKSDMRRFWALWEYVQSWSSTQIYVNGRELRKWEVYPYSPYLR